MSASLLVYCRFCAEKKPSPDVTYLKSTFRNEIVEKLSFFNINWIDLLAEDLPETICSVCYQSLNMSYEFFAKVKISQAVLTNLITNSLKLETCDDDASDHSYEDAPANIKEETIMIDFEIAEKREVNASFTDFSTENQPALTISVPPKDIKSETSWKVYPWICGQCCAKFDNIKLLRDHGKEAHGSCNSFRCADCNANIDNFNMFVDHVRRHRESLKLYCPHCNMKLEDATHYSIHTSQPNCSACGELFTNKSALNRHLRRYQQVSKKPKEPKNKMSVNALLSYGEKIVGPIKKIESWSDYPWMCQYCGTKVSDQHLLRSHLREVHGRCFGIQCVDCQARTQSFGAFVEHVREHRPSLKFYCQYCNYRLTAPDQNIIHIHEHHSDPQCDVCGEFFKETGKLAIHRAVYEPPKRKKKRSKSARPTGKPKKRARVKKEEDIKDLTCRVCHKIFTSTGSLRIHEVLHTDRRRDFCCDRCGKAFFTKCTLRAHYVIHENPDPQVCEICKKPFLTISRLKKHVSTHYVEKPFQCDECHKCFRMKDHLVAHMVLHSGTMPYKCQYCDKRFNFKNVCKNHETTHTGAKPYICRVCEMGFSCWNNCDGHMRRRHGLTMAKTKITPEGRVPITMDCNVQEVDIHGAKEWKEKIMVPRKRGRNFTTKNEGNTVDTLGNDGLDCEMNT